MSNIQGRDGEKDSQSAFANRRTFMGAVGALAGASALGGNALAGDDHEGSESEGDREGGDAHNAILVIPDGGAQAHISGARYLKAYQEDSEEFPLNITPGGTTLHVDRAEQIGGMSTYPDDPDLLVTDSGAAGSAMATGTKTYNGAISGVGSEDDFTPIGTVLEAAHEQGMATGLVTTTEITHATPAVFASHVPDRGMGEEIARQYVENANVDVLLGGGKDHFDPDERADGEDMIGQAQEQGYQYVETADELAGIDSGKLLGLFGSETDRSTHMSYYVDREYVDDTDEPGLVEMTEKAISLLSECEEGFFLMVESGRIDHQGHAHDNTITHEQLECDEVFGTVLDFTEDDSTPETLAIQVAEAVTDYGRTLGKRGAIVLAVYGGQPIHLQLKALRRGVQVVIGTPGRVKDHLERGTLDLSGVRFFGLDEADEMLKMGFIEDVEWILDHAPAERQIALFSATLPPPIRSIAERYQRQPVDVSITHKTLTVPKTEQLCLKVYGIREKDEAVERILQAEDHEAILIFAATRVACEDLAKRLQARGQDVESVHGGMSQVQRESVVRRLRAKRTRVIVATDVAARGLDVDHIGLVINYDLPRDREVYVHRIGRTGRAGRAGRSISFFRPRDR
ncbi:MAG: alkaline phosphatase, partial [Euryarchaeota archaeon]|nr:alkaline phosphatase [Euryarchaeota archaeon]